MASTAAISVVGRAILGLLAQSCPRAEWEGAQFELYQASNFKTPMAEGVSLHLYRVAPSGVRRNLAPRIDPDGRKTYRPSLPVELHYLLTAWARSAERQHQLLAWALRTLDDMPTLDSAFLNAFAPSGDDSFHSDETVTLVFEPVSIQDLLNIWEVGKPNLQVSASYLVSFVALDSAREISEYPPVQRRVLEGGRLVP
jgi:hypothetical protein